MTSFRDDLEFRNALAGRPVPPDDVEAAKKHFQASVTAAGELAKEITLQHLGSPAVPDWATFAWGLMIALEIAIESTGVSELAVKKMTVEMIEDRICSIASRHYFEELLKRKRGQGSSCRPSYPW